MAALKAHLGGEITKLREQIQGVHNLTRSVLLANDDSVLENKTSDNDDARAMELCKKLDLNCRGAEKNYKRSSISASAQVRAGVSESSGTGVKRKSTIQEAIVVSDGASGGRKRRRSGSEAVASKKRSGTGEIDEEVIEDGDFLEADQMSYMGNTSYDDAAYEEVENDTDVEVLDKKMSEHEVGRSQSIKTVTGREENLKKLQMVSKMGRSTQRRDADVGDVSPRQSGRLMQKRNQNITVSASTTSPACVGKKTSGNVGGRNVAASMSSKQSATKTTGQNNKPAGVVSKANSVPVASKQRVVQNSQPAILSATVTNPQGEKVVINDLTHLMHLVQQGKLTLKIPDAPVYQAKPLQQLDGQVDSSLSSWESCDDSSSSGSAQDMTPSPNSSDEEMFDEEFQMTSTPINVQSLKRKSLGEQSPRARKLLAVPNDENLRMYFGNEESFRDERILEGNESQESAAGSPMWGPGNSTNDVSEEDVRFAWDQAGYDGDEEISIRDAQAEEMKKLFEG